MDTGILMLSTLFLVAGIASMCIAASLRPERKRQPAQRPIIMVIEAPSVRPALRQEREELDEVWMMQP